MNDTLLDDEIPEKFKNQETGEANIPAMVKSYKELEKKMSQSINRPDTAEDYCVDCEHGVFEEDKALNERFYEQGFSNEQVQFVYDLAAEKIFPLAIEIAADLHADREVEKLIEHFGGSEKWQEISTQLLTFGQKSLPADVLDTLSSSYDGVIALYNMMQGKEPVISSNSNNANREDKDLQTMMRDPKYWRDKDPSFVAEVTEKFEKIYNK
ncbi:MAG: hypothetical protein AAF988_08050 [Pseudomonadota bacterium]